MRDKPFLLLIAILLAISLAGPASAQTSTVPAIAAIPDSPAGEQLAWTLEQVNDGGARLTPRRIETRFDPEFLQWFPPQSVIDVIRAYVAPHGPMTVARFEGGVTSVRANAILASETGYWRVLLSVEPSEPHRITNLYFEPAYIPTDPGTAARSWSSLKHRFARLAPEVSFMAAELHGGDCRPLARVEAEASLAIASSFKLYVLGELAHQIESGHASWDELLPIDPALISLPNGPMRYEAPGTPFPLSYYAEQMISQSDNTATDHLIQRLGREAVEQAMGWMGHASPALNTPLLMTREWFALRMRFSDRELRRYELATVDTKRRLIERSVEPIAGTLTEWEPWPAFRAMDSIEWFASAGDLCRAMASLQDIGQRDGMEPVLDALSIAPGITFDPAVWTYIGYKGGYETGVRSDVWLFQRNDGRWFALAGIINNSVAEIDGFGMDDLMIAGADLLARAE
jgi:beta-lactamase class A